MITQFLLWIVPPVVYFLMVRFFRKNVEDPFIPRVSYWFTPLFLIPIIGVAVVIGLLIGTLIATVSGCIEFKEESKFYKKWIEK